ncbi:MAG: hypothetical protein WCD70_15115 [Alphaproteobacteria bacterium]
MQEKTDWHLDKKITIGVIVAILINAGSSIWYASKLDSQVQATETEVLSLKVWKEKQDDDRERINSSLATVNQKLTDQGDLIRRIDDILESGMKRKFQ